METSDLQQSWTEVASNLGIYYLWHGIWSEGRLVAIGPHLWGLSYVWLVSKSNRNELQDTQLVLKNWLVWENAHTHLVTRSVRSEVFCEQSIESRKENRRGVAEMNPTRKHEFPGSIPGLTQWVKDLALLWLWHGPEATALIWPLAWELPNAVNVALKRQRTRKEKKKDIYIYIFFLLCISYLFIYLFNFGCAPMACGSSWAWGRTCATAVTKTTTLTTLDPYPAMPQGNLSISFLLSFAFFKKEILKYGWFIMFCQFLLSQLSDPVMHIYILSPYYLLSCSSTSDWI